jgi:hypothetical protein
MSTEEIGVLLLTIVGAGGFGYLFFIILRRAITERKPDNHGSAKH